MAVTRPASTNPGSFIGASTTAYYVWGDSCLVQQNTTEAQSQVPVRYSGGTAKNLQVIISNNGATATSTIVSRKNTANGNLTVSIGSGASGTVEDTTNSDTIASGDKYNYRAIWGSGGTANLSIMATDFYPSTDTFMRYTAAPVNNTDVSLATASQTNYCPIAGNDNALTTTEANVQYKCESTCTMVNMAIYVISNTWAVNTVFGSRIGGVNGNLSVTYGSAATGLIEDTTHSDAISAGSLINYFVTTGTGSGTIKPHLFSSEIYTSTGILPWVASSPGGNAFAANGTTYNDTQGLLSGTATESNVKLLLKNTYTLSKLFANISVNTVTAASTIRSRINGANGNMSFSVGSSAIGNFEDTTNTDVASTNANFQIVTGATGTSMTATMMGCMAAAVPIGKDIFSLNNTLGANLSQAINRASNF